MKIIIVDNNQSLWDVAIQEYGSCDGVKQLILDNTWMNFNDNIKPGSKVKITGEPTNKPIVDFLKKKGVIPASTWYDSGVVTTGDFNDDFNDDFNV